LEIAELEEEMNQMEQFKLEIINAGDTDVLLKTEKLDIAVNKLKAKLLQQRNRITDYQSFKTKAKWFE
jgi:hypothetical protein